MNKYLATKKTPLWLSIAFVLYGLLPFNKTWNIDTSQPNQIIIRHQSCGCPCPNAIIVKGQLKIPDSILKKYQPPKSAEINFVTKDLNEAYGLEVFSTNWLLKGKVVEMDTLLCEPTGCILIPRFEVEAWSLINYVARFWTFAPWLAWLFAINLLVILPILTVIVVIKLIKDRKKQAMTL
jgi:hypothetical protein